MEQHHLPNRANCFGIVDGLGNPETILNFIFRACCDRFFNEQSHTGQGFQNLQLDITSGMCRTAEHRRTSNNDCTRAVFRSHLLDEILKGLEDASVLVSRGDKRITFLLQDGSSALGGWVYESDNLEARSEFTNREISAKTLLDKVTPTVRGVMNGSMGPQENLVAIEYICSGRETEPHTKHYIACTNEEDIKLVVSLMRRPELRNEKSDRSFQDGEAYLSMGTSFVG